MWHICGTQGREALVSKVRQCQATKHKTADRGRSVRVSIALIIRRPSVQVRPAPLVFPQVTGLRSDARLWKSSLGSRLWHIRNLNPPVVVRAGPAPLTSAQVKRPGSRPGPFGARACGTSVAHVRVARRHTPTVIGANSDELKPRHKGSLSRPERRRHDPRSQVAEQPDEPSRRPDVLRRVRPDTAIAEGTQGKADRLHQRSGAARHRSARLPPRSRTSGRDHRPHPMRAPASWPGHVR